MKEKRKNTSLKLQFFKYVSLNIFGMIGLSCYILADTFFIANGVGTAGLTALNLILPAYSLLHATGLMIAIGGATKYSILRAQGKSEEAEQIFCDILKSAVAIGLVFTVAGCGFPKEIASLLGADAQIAETAAVYLRTLFSFSLFFVLNNVAAAFVRNDGNPGIAMASMLAGSLFNIILDYILVYPLGLGMFGAALATGISPVIGISVSLLHFVKKKQAPPVFRYKYRLKNVVQGAKLGASSFITEMANGIVVLVFNIVILKIAGNMGVAAYGIVANVAIVIISLFNGIAQGAQPLVSESYGKGEHKNSGKVTKWAICLAALLAVFVYGISYLFAGEIADCFNAEKNELLAEMAVTGIHIYFAGFLFAGINIVIGAYLAAVEKAEYAMVIALLRGMAAIIPFVFILSRLFGMNGVWLSFVCAEAVTMAAAVILYRKNKKEWNRI